MQPVLKAPECVLSEMMYDGPLALVLLKLR